MRGKINTTITIAVVSVITFYSLRPASTISPETGSMFPILHLLAYFALAGALLMHLHNRDNGYYLAVLAAFSFGLSMELLQTQIPGRFFTYQDLAINLTGASTVLIDAKTRFAEDFLHLEDRVIQEIAARQSI